MLRFQQALADVRRAGDIQQQAVDAQAVSAGAFGGSRQAVAQGEVDRNVLEQQGRTAAGMRQQGLKARRNGRNKLMKPNKPVVSRRHSLLAQLVRKGHSRVFLRQMLRVN
jgi:hypothetical protein